LSSPDNPQFDPQAPVDAKPQRPVPGLGDPFAATSIPPASLAPPVMAAPPVENPVWNGWDVLLTAALTFVLVFLLQLASAKAAQLLWYPRLSFFDVAQKVAQRPILLIISQFLFYVPVAVLMIALVEGKYHVPFWQSIRWNWPRTIGKFLALGAVLLLGLATLESLMPMPKDTPFEHLFDRPLDAYLLALIAITLGPLMEELFFRGLLYPVLARHMGPVWGIILSALPFALLHMPQYAYAWGALLVIFIVGVVCGIVRAVTHSVGASFLVHVGYNGSQMLIAIVVTHGFRHMEKALVHLR
jgi:uncharacterized protein